MRQLGEAGVHTFFGYHDVTPFSRDGRRLLASRCAADAGRASAGRTLTLGTIDLVDGRGDFEVFASTTTWCWQQGCRLQWYGNETDGRVFFNVSDGGRHASAIVDISSGRRTLLPWPLYAISADGRLGVSLNFARLQRLRPGYGYGDVPDRTKNHPRPADDGLHLIDIPSQKRQRFVSLTELAAFEPDQSMRDAEHYVNHALWSPLGSRCFFLHCWNTSEGRRRSRAFIWHAAHDRLALLGPRGQVSHHCWIDEDRMIVFGGRPDSPAAYNVYRIDAGYVGALGEQLPDRDGHPSLAENDRNLMITDTYPDGLSEQWLLLCDLGAQSVERIASFYTPPRFRGEIRCDLHPRWSRDASQVCVDSALTGERRMYVVGRDREAPTR